MCEKLLNVQARYRLTSNFFMNTILFGLTLEFNIFLWILPMSIFLTNLVSSKLQLVSLCFLFILTPAVPREVLCTSQGMSFTVLKSLLNNVPASNLYLNDGVCQPQESGNYYRLTWGLKECGNQVTYTTNKVRSSGEANYHCWKCHDHFQVFLSFFFHLLFMNDTFHLPLQCLSLDFRTLICKSAWSLNDKK